jgi:two-component sensor histidine kinase
MNETDANALMNEISHRLRNNTQMLQSLLGLAAREASIPETREVLSGMGRRVAAMSAAQDSLYCIDAINFEAGALLEALVRSASQGGGGKADIQIEAASGLLANDAAVPLALIVNELITNAVKHARGERGHVSIRIKLVPVDQEFVLEIADDGPGFTMGEPQKRASGLGLVIALARQLGGTLNVTTDRGARCVVRFGGPRSGP